MIFRFQWNKSVIIIIKIKAKSDQEYEKFASIEYHKWQLTIEIWRKFPGCCKPLTYDINEVLQLTVWNYYHTYRWVYRFDLMDFHVIWDQFVHPVNGRILNRCIAIKIKSDIPITINEEIDTLREATKRILSFYHLNKSPPLESILLMEHGISHINSFGLSVNHAEEEFHIRSLRPLCSVCMHALLLGPKTSALIREKYAEMVNRKINLTYGRLRSIGSSSTTMTTRGNGVGRREGSIENAGYRSAISLRIGIKLILESWYMTETWENRNGR